MSGLPAAVLCTLGALLCLSAPALATRGHVFNSSFGEKGSGPGQLTEPAGVAVNEVSGDVYVVDKGDNRVERFSVTGAYLGEFNGSGANLGEGKAAPTGRLSEPQSIAIDNAAGSPSSGDVYVVDEGHEVVDKFTASGEYVGQLTETTAGSKFGLIEGIAVDSRGQLWVYQGNKNAASFSDEVANAFLSSRELLYSGFANRGFTVDANDNIYAESTFSGPSKFDSTGKVSIEKFDGLLSEPYGIPIEFLAADLSKNEIYIYNADGEGSVARFSAAGSFIEKFGAEHITAAGGLTVDAGDGQVYAADSAADRVDVFAPEPESRPTIESEGPSAVTGTSATFNAQIKPTGPQTTYYFQYGTADCATTPAACSELPAAPGADLGAGFTGQSVSVHVQGLLPATTYHFRVIAVNGLGTSEGVLQSFVTQAVGGEFALPDGRLWEMVTPPEKHGSDLTAVGNEQGAAIQASDNGSAITYGATSPFATNPAGSRSPEVTQVFSTRDAPGVWSTADITTPHDEGATELAVGHSAEYKLFSSDLSAGLVEPEGHTPLPPLPAGSEKTIYLRLANGEYQALVSPANVPPGTKYGGNGLGAGAVEMVGATPDFGHIVIGSRVPLTSNSNGEGGLYEWTAGELQLINGGIGGGLGGGGDDVKNAISRDGSRVVLDAEHLYLRDLAQHEESIRLDAAQGAPEPSSVQSHYVAANSEDSRIFFTSPEPLTADATTGESGNAGADLYEFELTSAPGQPLAGKLTDLSVDPHTGQSADVRGVLGAAEDGSEVYFVANGVLGDGAEHGAKPGDCESTHEKFKATCNLYAERFDAASEAWSAPTHIATLSGADSSSWASNSNLKYMTARVSPNGRYLAFMSERSLTGYENRDANSGVPDEEVYLYDAGADRLVCASCNPTGARPAGVLEGDKYEERFVDYAGIWGERWFAANVPGWTTRDLSSALYQSRYLSNSGRLFFNSSDALVPADVNGTQDVYEYEPEGVGSCQGESHGQSASDVFDAAVGGCVGLISAGTSSEESAFMDASETGADVFFLTGQRLSPADFDTSVDLYDAHECSTAAPCAPLASAAPLPCTTGDACKAAPTPQPAVFGAPSSETFSGAGNVVPVAPGKPAVTPKAVTGAQRLASALKACKKKPKRKRAACERKARKRFAATKAEKSDRTRAGHSSSTGTRR